MVVEVGADVAGIVVAAFVVVGAAEDDVVVDEVVVEVCSSVTETFSSIVTCGPPPLWTQPEETRTHTTHRRAHLMDKLTSISIMYLLTGIKRGGHAADPSIGHPQDRRSVA